MQRRTVRRALGLGLFFLAPVSVGVLLLGGRPQAEPVAAASGLRWQGCDRFECATLQVPLDYANPFGPQIDIALIRQTARDPSRRIGSLVVNPGGPGGSGVDFLRFWALFVAPEVQDRFDIVGFDPRGVGASTPLLCHDNLQQLVALDPSPDSPDEWQEVANSAQAFAALCAERGGDLLHHIGTKDVVSDLDQIRQALGDDQLTYFGYSYGTVIGAVYADFYPDRVRAMVLDGAVDVSIGPEQLSIEQARGFAVAYQRFLADCRARQCLPASRGDPEAAIDELLRRVEVAPIPAPNVDRPAGPGETLTAIFGALYTEYFWPQLALAVDNGLNGDGSGLVRLTDIYLGRRPDGGYDNLIEVNTAVNCVDYAIPRDVAYIQDLAARAEAEAPRFGASNAGGWLSCVFWAATPSPLQTPHAAGAPPIVIIGTSGDPATPYHWAVAMSRQLQSAVLLTYYGEGHTAYLSGSECIDGNIDLYLIDLQPPAPGTSCGDSFRSPIPTP